MLRIYDTAARAKVDFVPRTEGAVSMYECGPTPYDAPHIGHGRTAVSFDTIRRYLRWLGYRVTYVKNVTDVEDRIQRVHFLRNRIAHHEPIHHRDQSRDHASVIELSAWICAESHHWIDSRSRYAEVARSRP